MEVAANKRGCAADGDLEEAANKRGCVAGEKLKFGSWAANEEVDLQGSKIITLVGIFHT